MATAAYVQSQGIATAGPAWSGAADDPARYNLAKPYLAFAPASLSDYVPGGFAMDLHDTVNTLTKVELTDSSGAAINY